MKPTIMYYMAIKDYIAMKYNFILRFMAIFFGIYVSITYYIFITSKQ